MRGFALIVVLVGLLAAAVAGVALYADHRATLERPLLGTGASPVEHLLVEPGDGLGDVARELGERGLLERPWHLVLHARLHGLAHRIQAGEYAIAPGTTPVALLERLVQGRVVQHALTLVEGWTFAEALAEVRAHPALEHTLGAADAAAVMARLGRPGAHPEGRLYPDTYHFPRATTDVAFLERAMRTMDRVLAEEWAGREDDLPLESPYEALVLASIVEKETGAPHERQRVAGVFVERLRRGMPLATDPTVIYGLGEAFDGDLRKRDLRADTPYNTYLRRGLPPTPIALPGRDAIHAALHPAADGALYFVARGDGTHHFSATYEEHRRAVARYQLGREGGAAEDGGG